MPIAVGVLGFVALLLNRTISGVAPVVDASSSQSRVDILVVAMAASLALTGFQWLTLAPITPTQVRQPCSTLRQPCVNPAPTLRHP